MPRLLLVLIASVFGMAGCGGGEELDQADQERIDRAGERMAREESYAADITFAADGGPEAIGLDGRIRGSNDQTRSAFEGTMDLPGVGTVNVEFIGLGEDLYLKGDGQLGAQIPDGKEWINTGSDTQPLGFGEFLDFLRAGDDFENRGDEEIDGTPTTHYGGPIDLEALAREGGGEDDFAAAFGGADVEAEVDVWISGDGVPVQMDVVLEAEEGGESAQLEASITSLEFGVDISDIEAPDPATVAAGP